MRTSSTGLGLVLLAMGGCLQPAPEELDAGTPPRHGGISSSDAGVDAGVDAGGPAGVDAGNVVDAGGPARVDAGSDAGRAGIDAGGPVSDAGTFNPDAGARDGGCVPPFAASCDDGPFLSQLAGACLPDGTCSCATNFELNPQTGRCRSTLVGCSGQLAPYLPLTPAQAACVGIASPVCEGCHRPPCGYQLRPTWAPPPPPNVNLAFDAGCLL